MAKRIFVLGYDAVSPLGDGAATQWTAAAAGRSGVGRLTRFPVPEGFPVTVAGQVADIDDSPYPFLHQRPMAGWTSPIFRHGMLVAHRALQAAGLEIDAGLAPRVATTFSTAIGGLDAMLAADRIMQRDGKSPKPYVNPNACINMITGKVSILTGATGPIVTTIAACATGSISIITGAMFLQAGMADVAICGAVDFPLVEPVVAGFATMNGAYKAKPPDDEPPESVSRPFAVTRRGFVVSEGAGAIILATEEFARAHGLAADVELAGWATNSDAFHFVAPKLETVTRCIADAISAAGLAPSDIDAVNAHAASTKVGDRVEAEALHQVFGGRPPAVTANKSMIGHAMGASSALESILAIDGMRHGVLTPTLNFDRDEAVPPLDLTPVAAPLEQEHVLKNAFGFGGCNACLIFRRLN
jgi:3-oxoacyl-[acyl-carrier-protein] synthase II